MVSFVVDNNVESTVADNPLAQSATTLNVAAGEGANFPSTFPFRLTIWDDSTYPDPTDDSGMEIVECTARATDALTIARGKEGTGDVAHANGERVALLITAGLFNDATYGITTKLDGIEASATADQTGGEIKTLYEAEVNAYTDTKDIKLTGIDTGADVTGSNPPQSHGASVHTDRLRRLIMPAPHKFSNAAQNERGFILADATADELWIKFRLPSDYSVYSALNVYLYSNNSGNIVFDATLYYSGVGEHFQLNSNTDLTNTLTLVDNDIYEFSTIGLLTSVTTADVISLKLVRQGSNGSDTLAASIYFMMAELVYTADM